MRLQREEGQTLVEWLAVMALVVALGGLVLAALPGVGDAVVDAIEGFVGAF